MSEIKLTYTTVISQKQPLSPLDDTERKFEEQFEKKMKLTLQEWKSKAVQTIGHFEDSIEYVRGHYRLYQDAYDQVWLFQRITINE